MPVVISEGVTMLRRIVIYILTLSMIAGYGLIAGAEHVVQYQLKQSHLIKELTQ